LNSKDATFLSDVIGRLPSDDPQYNPVTVDLNGKVLIRSRDAEQRRPTEVELTSSRLVGVPVVFNTDRRYVERAVRLGFREARILGPNSPVLCQDERRKYLWAILSPEGVIPRSDDPIRIESRPQAAIRSTSRKHRSDVMPATKSRPDTSTPETAKPNNRIARSRPATKGGPTEQAIALRDSLRVAALAAHQLVRSLKQHKRQSRIVESTLASLKQLQKAAG